MTAPRRGLTPARRAAVRLGVGYAATGIVYVVVRPRTWGRWGLLELAAEFAPWWYAAAPPMVVVGRAWRSVGLTFAGLALGCAFALAWGRRYLPRRAARPPARGGPVLAVMTYNVLWNNDQHATTAATILAEGPDVVALQELGPPAAEYLVRALADRYPHCALRPDWHSAGSGVFSRYPLSEVDDFRLSPSGQWSQRMRVHAPSGPLTVLNIHTRIPRVRWSGSLGPLRLPIGYDASTRRSEITRLLEVLDGIEGACVVLGDFNMTEHGPEYARLHARLADAYRAVGYGLGHTFPSPLPIPQSLPAPWPLLRLDYAWHSPEFRPLAAYLGRSGGSDHRPLVVRLAWGGA